MLGTKESPPGTLFLDLASWVYDCCDTFVLRDSSSFVKFEKVSTEHSLSSELKFGSFV